MSARERPITAKERRLKAYIMKMLTQYDPPPVGFMDSPAGQAERMVETPMGRILAHSLGRLRAHSNQHDDPDCEACIGDAILAMRDKE